MGSRHCWKRRTNCEIRTRRFLTTEGVAIGLIGLESSARVLEEDAVDARQGNEIHVQVDRLSVARVIGSDQRRVVRGDPAGLLVAVMQQAPVLLRELHCPFERVDPFCGQTKQDGSQLVCDPVNKPMAVLLVHVEPGLRNNSTFRQWVSMLSRGSVFKRERDTIRCTSVFIVIVSSRVRTGFTFRRGHRL